MKRFVKFFLMTILLFPCLVCVGEARSEDSYTIEINQTQYGGGKIVGEVDAPPEVVWNVLLDYESRKLLQKKGKSSKIIERDGNRVRLRLQIGTKWPLPDVVIISDNMYDPERGVIEWKNVEGNGNLNANFGYWQVEKHNGRSLVTYHFNFDQAWIPKVLENSGSRKSLIYTLEKIRQLVKEPKYQVGKDADAQGKD